MPELKIEYLLLFTGFVLPGAISMYVYGLKVPQESHLLRDKVLEAICFSLLNFVILIWPIQFLFVDGFVALHPSRAWGIVVVCFIVMPVIWPILMVWLLRVAEKWHWIGLQPKTAWDYFFKKGSACWIQLTLKDGTVVGGRYDIHSYASAYPEPGHIYIEELWEIDLSGNFINPLNGSPGIILRPDDYKHIKVFDPE